jgi:hypothetical protein
MLPIAQRLLSLLCLGFVGFFTGRAEDAQKVTFHIQLIHGADADNAENPHWRAIGPKLSRNLRAVFRWTNYWEVRRESVTLTKGGVAKIQLTPDRAVEIKLLDPPKTQIRLFYKGELTRCSHQPIREHMTILGGDSTSGDPWFVVVRRDKPPDAK